MVLLITQNIHVKIPKYPQRQSFFFVFSEAKSVILPYIKIEKNLKYPYPITHSFFFYLEDKNTIINIIKCQKSS
jgi:hypothetical protein